MSRIGLKWVAPVILSVACAALAPTQPITAPLESDASSAFAYDRSAPFDLKEESVKEQEGVTIRDINYASRAQGQGRTQAYLITPKGKGPFAGVLFFHWLGEEKSDRTEFLEEATALAKQGTVSLLIQGFFPWKVAPIDGPTDRQRIIEQTIEVLRGLDLLLAQPGTDPKRIGYVGHDYGAMFGSIVSGFDRRVKAYVLMAALGNFSDWSLKYWPRTAAKGEQAYRQAVTDLDPINYVSHASPAAFLFQFAKTDKYISKDAATSLFEKASEPKQVKWYDATHNLEVSAAHKDRDDWLTRELGLAKAMR